MANPMSEMANILHELVADDSYQTMLNRFTMAGKGRRPDVTPPPLTNRLLVQLWDIMLRNGDEQKKVIDWFGYLYSGNSVLHQASPGRLRSIISSTYRKAVQLVEGPRDVVISYLDLIFDFNFISDSLSAANIDRSILLGQYSEFSKPQNFKLTNSIVVELDKFQRTEGFIPNFMAKWVFYLINESEAKEQDSKVIKNLIQRLDKLRTKKTKLQTRKKPDDYQKFLDEEFCFNETNPKCKQSNLPNSSISSSNKSVEKGNISNNNPVVLEKSKMCNTETELLKIKIAKLEKELEDFKKVKEESMNLKRENQNLKRKISRNSIKLATASCHLQNSERKRKLEIDQKDSIINDLEATLEMSQ